MLICMRSRMGAFGYTRTKLFVHRQHRATSFCVPVRSPSVLSCALWLCCATGFAPASPRIVVSSIDVCAAPLESPCARESVGLIHVSLP